jgi:hypothetical protein
LRSAHGRGARGVASSAPTALVHEAYLRLGAASFAERSGFLRAAAVVLDGDTSTLGADPDLVLDIAAAPNRLAREDLSSAEVVRHRLFGGWSIGEIAAALGLSRATAFRERTRAGLDAARARGKRGGRRPKLDAKRRAQALILHRDKPNTIDDICRTFRVGRSALNRCLAEERQQ